MSVSLYQYQKRVRRWVENTFGKSVMNNQKERASRVLEESMELAQSLGLTKEDCNRISDVVWSKPIGRTSQEIAGVFVTLLACTDACNEHIEDCLTQELVRIESTDRNTFRRKHILKKDLGISIGVDI